MIAPYVFFPIPLGVCSSAQVDRLALADAKPHPQCRGASEVDSPDGRRARGHQAGRGRVSVERDPVLRPPDGPRLDELDPLDETGHEPVKNLIHNYEDRVAFCVTAECAIYCRYCLRKRMVGDAEYFMRTDEHQAAIDYIAAHDEIRDVLLTGGDPLTFNEANLEWLLSRLRAIDHVELIRFGSRMPVKLPYRITDDLCDLLAQYHPLWINTHFNHPPPRPSAASRTPASPWATRRCSCGA
jgi:hypothetical protein